MLQFASERMEFSQRLPSANELLSGNDIIKDTIENLWQKFVKNLIQEIENAMKENIEVLNHFDGSNTKSTADRAKNIFKLAK